MLRSRSTLILWLGSAGLLLASGCDCAGEPRPTRDAGNTQLGDDGGDLDRDGGPQDVCGDGLDDDRDGMIDEGCSCTPGAQQRCFGGEPALAGIGACVWGIQDCASSGEFGMWDVCGGDGAPSAERCNGVDDDCDGVVDEGCECPEEAERPCYDGPAGTDGVGICRAGVERCEVIDGGSRWSGTCVSAVAPVAEACDGSLDEDCDGVIDEGCICAAGDSRACYDGPAGTRDVGECASGTQTCTAAGWGACAGVTTPASEACTGGRDEDCDGLIDCADSDCDTHTACCTPFDETVPIVPVDAEILFVVDRSGSMDWPAVGTTATRWLELSTAMSMVLPSLTDLHLGMLTFPLMDGTSELNSCLVAATPEIGVALGTGPAIDARLVAADPRGGDTPTPQAFATARSYLASLPATARPRFVVLATDGLPEPHCGATVSATAAAIAALRADFGIDTFVLGFVGPDRTGDASGIPALQAALNDMAVAGGRARAGALRYYEAVDGPAFERSLRAILASATDCTVELAATPTHPASIVVRQNGIVVAPSGYTLIGRRLEFSGASCDAIRSGAVTTISVSDTCGP